MTLKERLLQKIKDTSNIRFFEGFDDAIIGYGIQEHRFIYSLKKCTEILMERNNENDFDKSYFKVIMAVYEQFKEQDNLMPVFCLDFVVDE